MQMNHDITIQDVFHRFLPQYCETHNFSPQQQLTALCISKCHSLYDKNWVVYTKEAFNGADSVIHYLGRYTHRIAISNRRIVSMTDETVTYLVKDYKNGGKYIEQTIKGTEFLRMFLMHVLPKGFVRIRHYGLLSCRNKKEKMAHCRKLLNCIQYISKLRGKTCAEKLMILYKKDICKCEACGGNLHSLSLRGRYMLT